MDEIAGVLLSCGIKTVVIKNGKNGCFIKTKENVYTIPTYNKARRVDTIGAGDILLRALSAPYWTEHV